MHRNSAQRGVSGTLKQLFAPTILTDEDSNIRTTRSLRAAIIANMLFALPLAVLVFLTSQRNYAGGLIAFMISLFASLTPLFLLRRGKIKLAGGLFLTVLWLMTSVTLLVSTGSNTMLGSLYVAVVMMTLLFFGWRMTLISITITLAYTLIITLADLSNVPKLFAITPLASWVLLVLCLMLVLIPLASMYTTLLRALATSQEQLVAREKAEQALRENADRLQLISSVTSDYMFTTHLGEDGRWREQILSGAFETITGYTPEAFKALGGWTAIIHPDDLVANKIYTQRLFENQRSSVELRIIRKDGQIRWVRVSAHPIWDAEKQTLRAVNGGVQDITARKEVEQTLRDNEERFRLISTVTSDYTFSSRFDTQGGLQHTVLSGAFEAITGYTPDEFVNIGGWAAILHPDDRDIDKHAVDVLSQNQPSTGEVRITRKDGQVRWVRVSAYPIWDEESQELVGINGAVQDITARKVAEIALQANEKRYRMTTELISDYAYAYDIHDDGTLTCSWVTEQPFKRLTGYDWDDPRAQYMLYHPDDARRARLDAERTAKGEPTDGEYRIVTTTGEVRWLHIQRQIEWDADHRKPLRFYGAAEDITARKLAEDALRASESLLRTVINHLPDNIYVKDREGRFLINNSESLRRLGGATHQEEVLGKTDFDYFPYELAERWTNDVRAIMEAGEPVLDMETNEVWVGNSHWILSSVIPLRDNEKNIIGHIGINRDITERKNAEKVVRESEVLLRAVIDHIPDPIYVKDLESRFLINNTESLRRIGVASQEDTLGKTDFDFYPHEIAAEWDQHYKRIMASGIPVLNDEVYLDLGGDGLWFSVSFIPFRNTEGEVIGLVSINRDITTRKQAENALQESERRYRLTSELISDYAYAYNIEADGTRTLAWITEQSFQRLTGYSVESMRTRMEIYHPDDRERVSKDVARTMRGEATDSEYRIITAAGEVKWLNVVRQVEWDAAKTHPIRYYGSATDITERKHAELALQESEARLRALLDATNDVAFLMSADFRILTANKPLARIVGKPLDAIIGDSGTTHVSSEVFANRHKYFEEVIQTKQPVRWIDSRNMEQWDNSIYPVLSPSGEVESFAVFGRDISEEARLAAELQRYATQLEHMVEERTTELRRAKEQIEIILNNTRDAIALAQPNGDIQTRNPAFVAMFGEQVSRWIEGLLWTVSGEEHSASVGQALMNTMQRREGQRIETQITVENNGDKDIDLMFIPVALEEEAEQPGILVSAHDITPYKEVQRFKERFVANAVHDLATPIAGLSTRLYLLKRSPEKLDVHMKALENQVEHFRDLLNDLRTLSQLDRKQVTLELELTNMQQNILRVFDTYEPVALSKNQMLDLALDPDLPDMMLDRRQIERVFLNLVSNAINYSPEGKTIRIRVAREDNSLVFSVTDEGMGISAGELPHVFERFYRSDRARQTRSSGSGLGLAIVKEIVELHGGTVAVQSEAGTGSTFTVRLPVKQA